MKRFAGALATAAVRVGEQSGVDSVTLRRTEKEFSLIGTIFTIVKKKYVCRVLARNAAPSCISVKHMLAFACVVTYVF